MQKIKNLTVAMITLNEEVNLKKALPKLLERVDNVVILDSYSNDNTEEICQNFGVDFFQSKFKGFGDQWNKIIDSGRIKTKWCLKVDPDEEITDSLWEEIDDLINRENPRFDAYKFSRVLYFAGKKTPVSLDVERLWNTHAGVRFTEVRVNEHLDINRVGRLSGKMIHYDVPIERWISKQSKYCHAEALTRNESSKRSTLSRKLIFRKLVKENYYRIPGIYLLIYTWYFLRYYRFSNRKALTQWIRSRIVVLWLRDFYFFEMMSNEADCTKPG